MAVGMGWDSKSFYDSGDSSEGWLKTVNIVVAVGIVVFVVVVMDSWPSSSPGDSNNG